VGPDLPRDVHFAIGNFIRDSLSGEAIHIRGDGSPIRSYMDQRDLARWLVVLLNEGRPAEAYNVGSDVAHSIAEVATKVRDILCPEKSIRIMSIETARGVRDRYVPSTDKVRIELGLVLHHTLEASLRAFKQTLK
jgi:dTDP-glucose 4,6-dehydratase